MSKYLVAVVSYLVTERWGVLLVVLVRGGSWFGREVPRVGPLPGEGQEVVLSRCTQCVCGSRAARSVRGRAHEVELPEWSFDPRDGS